MTLTSQPPAAAAVRPGERERFERDGYLIIREALGPAEVRGYAAALDRVYDQQVSTGAVTHGGDMHLLSAVARCPDLIALIDHPSTFRYVWSVLGWNIHIYHSHIDVHPPLTSARPYRFEWHQDGGRQNRELETDPRPRLSVKVAYWLSDVSQPGRGNLQVVPGSHRVNRIAGPPRRDLRHPDPAGAIQVTASPGDAIVFDRRLWHARSGNHSAMTRKAVFLGYTYRWVVSRDAPGPPGRDGWARGLSPVRRQLLGWTGGDGDHRWGHDPGDTPLYGFLADRGLLDPACPPLRP